MKQMKFKRDIMQKTNEIDEAIKAVCQERLDNKTPYRKISDVCSGLYPMARVHLENPILGMIQKDSGFSGAIVLLRVLYGE